ncbi:39S ribosomal protein L24, mitochondrial [Serendipita sp. 407]|nr:39S ribosomal protein L24, mitochondrial [Serendipita sp. 407]
MHPSQLFHAPPASKFKYAEHFFKRAQAGLFHGRTIQFGNNVPESRYKTRRTWQPNVRSKRMKSEILNQVMRWNVTMHAMRTVKKYGSLDDYLLKVRTKWLGERAMLVRTKLQDEVRKQEQEQAKPTSNGRRKWKATQLEKMSDKLMTSIPKPDRLSVGERLS